jgi:hypothetical protein
MYRVPAPESPAADDQPPSPDDPVRPTLRPVDRAPAVRWLSPTELGRTGLKVLLGLLLGQYVDKREMQDGPTFGQGPYFDHTGVPADESYWLDFVADIGDGFDPTYSVASLIANDIDNNGEGVLRRGSVLVMGGDEVYPSGDVRGYEQRTTGVYAAALPGHPEPRPVVYAVPGNHDWYDGLTSFLRVFAQSKDIGGWATQQRRSYFALRLPHGWWLWGVDISLNTYIDRPQLEYFREVGEQMADGDRLILCTAKPAWYDFDRDKRAGMDQLTHFLKYVLAGRNVSIPLILTGDSHHYARYQCDGDDPQLLVTSGHGGAYLSATHKLPDTLQVPKRLADPAASRFETQPYELRGRWPSASRSRRLATRVLWRLLIRNPGLPLLFALFQAGFVSGIVRDSWSVLVGLIALAVVGSVAFAGPSGERAWAKRWWGLTLAIPQVALSWGVGELCAELVDDWSEPAVVAAVGGVALVAGYLASELLALWLLVVSRFGVNLNELFAAQSIEDHKGFLRLRIGPDGGLTIYPIGIERCVRAWRPGNGDGPRLVPDQGQQLRPTLIEPPVSVR